MRLQVSSIRVCARAENSTVITAKVLNTLSWVILILPVGRVPLLFTTLFAQYK